MSPGEPASAKRPSSRSRLRTATQHEDRRTPSRISCDAVVDRPQPGARSWPRACRGRRARPAAASILARRRSGSNAPRPISASEPDRVLQRSVSPIPYSTTCGYSSARVAAASGPRRSRSARTCSQGRRSKRASAPTRYRAPSRRRSPRAPGLITSATIALVETALRRYFGNSSRARWSSRIPATTNTHAAATIADTTSSRR